MSGDSERLARVEERVLHLVDQQARTLTLSEGMDGRLRRLEDKSAKAAGVALAGRVLWALAASWLGAALAVGLK